MRMSSLTLAVFLLVSAVVSAQHSSPGGSSSVGSHSSSSGGGSTSGSYAPSTHSSAASASHRSSVRLLVRHPIEKNTGVQNKNAARSVRSPHLQRRGFFAFLRHPFRQPAEADLRRPICKGKPCPCPTKGKGGGCAVSSVTNDERWCPWGEYWNGSGCATLSLFRLNDCSDLALALNRQARQMQLAKGRQWISCSHDALTQECSDLTATYQTEAARYEALQQQYAECRKQLFDGLRLMSGIN